MRSVCVVNMIMRMVMVFVKAPVVLVVSMSVWMRVGVRMRMRGSALADAFVEHEGAEGHNRETGDGGCLKKIPSVHWQYFLTGPH